jgi:membrane protein
VPNTKVRVRAAVAGGVFAGLFWAGGGNLFAQFVVTASRTEAIYSGFAIVIVAMMWLYLSWLILLSGAQLAFYVQNPDDIRLGSGTPKVSNAIRERLALNIMLLVGRDFDEAGHGWQCESLAARLRVPRHILEPVVSALEAADLLTATAEGRMIPARDPRRIALLDILAAVRSPLYDLAAYRGREWNSTVLNLEDRIGGAIAEALDSSSLADLVGEDETREPRAEATPLPP